MKKTRAVERALSSARGCAEVDFTDLDHLAERLMAFVTEWNVHAHPFN